MICLTHSLFIDPKIHIKNLLPACGERINRLIVDDYVENKMDRVVQGHYNIRHGLMSQQVCTKLKDQYYDRMSHIKVIREIALNSPIVICTSWKEYNMRLKMNSGTEENDYTDKDTSIPLLNIKGYSGFFNTIYSNIAEIRMMNGSSLSCLQSIIFYYMTQVTSRGKYTHMNILELYKMIDQYDEFDVDHHDDFMTHLDKLCAPLLDFKMSWNPNVSIEYGQHIILKTQIDLIGYNKDTVLLTYFKPELNRVNYTELKIKAFVDSYIVSKCSNVKYVGKKIKVCFISKDIYFCEYLEFDALRTILKDTLYDYFSIKNKEVVQFKGSTIRPSAAYIHKFMGMGLEGLNRGLRESLMGV